MAPLQTRFEKLPSWAVLVISLLIAEALTALIVIGFSLLFRGEIAADYMITGAVTCLVVASLIVHVVQEFNERLRRARTFIEQAEQERTSLQRQLFEAQKLEAIGQLAGGVAHDFNNLLGGVLGNIAYLQEQNLATTPIDETAEVLRDIRDAAEHGATLSKQLLTFARRDPGEVGAVQAREIVDSVLRMQRRTFDPAIRLTTNVADGLAVLGNRGQLEQVLMNLCINARDELNAGGDIRIEGRAVDVRDHATLADGRYVQLSVADNGGGMDEETRQRVFEPFFTRKGPGGGTGLGLAVVYGIVSSHGGTVDVRSSPGEGAVFTLLLPMALGEEQPAPRPSPATASTAGSVLLVDDEPHFRRATARLLEQRGFVVEAVGAGQEAVRWFAENPRSCDVVLLDVVMPEMDGEQVFAALRALRPNLPVVMMSGYDGGHRVGRVLEAGAAGWVRKPFEPDDLVRALRAAVA